MRRCLALSPACRALLLFCLVVLLVFSQYGHLSAQDHKTSSAKPPGKHSATINWDASNSPVAGYNVYRSSSQGGAVKLTPKPVSETRFIDRTVVAGRTYTYTVTSVDSKGVESKPSEKVAVTIPATAPPPPKP